MTPESRKMIHEIMDSESMGYAYVYPLDGSPRREYLISLSPENMANFIGKQGYNAEKIIITDVLDRLVVNTSMVFLDTCCFLASNFPHFHRYDSLKSALYIHAVSKNINTFPKNQGRIRAAIAVEILDFTVMYR